jgi:hypothetical protein
MNLLPSNKLYFFDPQDRHQPLKPRQECLKPLPGISVCYGHATVTLPGVDGSSSKMKLRPEASSGTRNPACQWIVSPGSTSVSRVPAKSIAFISPSYNQPDAPFKCIDLTWKGVMLSEPLYSIVMSTHVAPCYSKGVPSGFSADT